MKNPELGGEFNQTSRTLTAWKMIQSIFNALNHTMIIFVAIYMTYKSYTLGNKPIGWHVFLCTLGYQLLMTQSILVFYSENLWSSKFPRSTQRTLHWILQAVGSTAAIVGMVIEYIAKYQQSRNHFTSTHALYGLIAGIFTIIGMLNGVSALWSVELRSYIRPVYLKLLHNLIGMTAFVLGMIALYYGYKKGTITHSTSNQLQMWLKTFAIITIVLSLIGAVRAAYNHIRNVFINW